MNDNTLVQRTNLSASYIDARWEWNGPRAYMQDGSQPILPHEIPVYNLQQANARSILNKNWDHHKQTSRSTYKWNHNEKTEVNTLRKLTASDYRGFVIDTLDAEVYSPFCSPGLHVVPPEFTRAEYLVINNFPWGKKNKETVVLGNGEIVERKQFHKIQKWEAQITMIKTADGCHFYGITPDKKEKFFHSRDFVATMETTKFSNYDWKSEIIEECSRRLFEAVFQVSELEELWLSKDDTIIEREVYEGDSTRYHIAFYYIDVEQPTKTDILKWKRIQQAKDVERARQERLDGIRRQWRTVNINTGRSRAFSVKTPPELKALKTLRDLISEQEYRRYLTNGFIMAQGKSGLHYQIFCDQRNIQVWKNNRKAFSICIHTDRKCPPTDHVINCKLLVDFDEQEVWRGGNIHGDIRISASEQIIEDNWHLIIGENVVQQLQTG